jgi:hypothetical protein
MDSDSPPQSIAPVDGPLPGYTSRASVTSRSSSTLTSTVERVYSLENRKGQKWASLVVRSRAPNNKYPPLFLENDIITGRVELDLGRPKTFKAIVISVRGVQLDFALNKNILFLHAGQGWDNCCRTRGAGVPRHQ